MNLVKSVRKIAIKTGEFLLKSAYGGVFPYVPGIGVYGIGNLFTWGAESKTSQLQAYRNIVVYAIVNTLTRKLIEAPLLVYKEKNSSENRKLKRYNFKDGNKLGKYNLLKARALEEVESHNVLDKIDKPNNYMTGIQLREDFWLNYNLSGDAFLWAEVLEDGPRTGKILHLHSLQSDRVTIVKNLNDHNNPVEYYLFYDWNGVQHRIDPKYIMHLAKWSYRDPALGGFSPIIPGAKTISRNEANQIAQGQAFTNGGTGVIVSSDVGTNKDGNPYNKLTPEQVGNMKDTVQRDWAGAHNSRKIHITNGYVEVKKLGDTLVDLDAIDAEKSDWMNIGAIYGVNPILVGDMSGGTDNNVQAAYKALVTNVVVSELRKFDEKFNEFISRFVKDKIEVKHDLTEFSELAPDLKLMKEVYGNSWQVTPNEYREIINLERSNDPNMDKFYIPSGFMALDDINTSDFDQLDGNFSQNDYK